MVAYEEQIAVGVGRADRVTLGHAVKGEHNRLLDKQAVPILGFRRRKPQHHVGEAQKRGFHRFEQARWAHRLAHTDAVARHAGHVLLGCVQENLAIAVCPQQWVVG